MVNVLLPMCADDKIAVPRETVPCQRVRGVDVLPEVLENIGHRRSCFHNALWRETFGNEISPRVLCVRQIYIAGMVHNSAVDFFWNPVIEAAVTRFHVENRNLSTFSNDNAKARIC